MIEGKNYLIPVDGLDASNPFYAMETYIELGWLVKMLAQSRPTETVPIIIILDCCRTDASVQEKEENYSDVIKDEGNKANIFIVYATGSNSTSSDGKERNGAFTEFLLKHMDKKENIDDVCTTIRNELYRDKRYQNMQVCL